MGLRHHAFEQELGMSLQGHLSELTRRHQAIDKQIDSERTHPSTDKLKLTALKRRKLQIKDEIVKLQH